MRSIRSASKALCAVAGICLVASALSAAPKDWESGWNTWKTAKEGDWVTYSLGAANTKYAADKVKGDKITYTFSTYDGTGKETSSRESTKEWRAIKLNGKLPYKIDVKWDTEEFTVGEKKVNCDTASWVNADGSTQAVWYSKDVPCGGVVQQLTNGKSMVWLTGFGSKSDAIDADKEPAPKIEPPKFFTTVGNKAQYKASVSERNFTWQIHAVTDVKDGKSTYTIQFCTEGGSALPGRTPREMTWDLAEWKKDHAKPADTGVRIKVGDKEYTCELFEYTKDKTEVQEWISEGVIIKRVETTGDVVNTLELVKLEMK